MARSTVSVVMPWPVRMIVDQLVEEPLDEGHLGGLAAQGDLVAADVDVGGEGLLDQGEVLVPGPEQGHHGDARGHGDGVLRGVDLCHRWPVRPPSLFSAMSLLV